MTRPEQVTAIAEAFGEILRQWLSREEMAEVQRRNGLPEYGAGACASHDFCDANVAMAAAMQGVMGREPDPGDAADAALWGEAWDLARKLYLEA